MSVESTFENTLAGCMMPGTIVQLLPDPQMSDGRSRTTYEVVEQLNHNSGDYLV